MPLGIEVLELVTDPDAEVAANGTSVVQRVVTCSTVSSWVKRRNCIKQVSDGAENLRLGRQLVANVQIH